MASENPGTIEARIPLSDLVRALADPAVHGQAEPVEVVETHISVVFLTRHRAWKVKKPIRLWGLVDYGTVEARRRCCEEEVRLNRRLAPDLYLGVVPVVRRDDGQVALGGDGEVLEHAVEMVRLARGATLAERLAQGAVQPAEIGRVARTLADFHRAVRLAPDEAQRARPSAFGAILRQNFRATHAGGLFPEAVHEGLRRRVASRLWGARDLLRRRIAEGRAVDGHGDVRLEHVVRHQGRTQVIDCVEFTPRLRHVDPLSDVAFLAMDLTVSGRRDLAVHLVDAYREAAAEPAEPVEHLLPLFLAYRAHVRAKVDAQVAVAPGIAGPQRAARRLGALRHLALAWSYARRDLPGPLVVMHGPSGTGKSVLAHALAPALDAEVISSDVVRKRLAGLEPTARPDGAARDALYAHDMSQRTYAEVLRLGLEHARGGRAALLDATYLRADARRAVADAAREAGAPLVLVDMRCPEPLVRERLRRRAREDTDASDADLEIHRAQLVEAEPLSAAEAAAAVVVEAGNAPEEALMAILERLEAQGREGGGPRGSS